jgi:hypothetical protein
MTKQLYHNPGKRYGICCGRVLRIIRNEKFDSLPGDGPNTVLEFNF